MYSDYQNVFWKFKFFAQTTDELIVFYPILENKTKLY